MSDLDVWFDQLTGLRSSKPTFYPEYRRKAQGLDRTLETYERVSAALCDSSGGAHPLGHAVVEALAAHYPHSWVALSLREGPFADQVGQLFARTPQEHGTHEWSDLPAAVRALADQAIADGEPAVLAAAAAVDLHGQPPWLADRVATPMVLRGRCVGALVVVLPAEVLLDLSDLSLVRGLANQAALAIENACLVRQVAVARERMIIDEERARIARELHDTVAQHLISIGMHLEWCRGLPDTGVGVGERLTLAKELARAAISHMRTTIYELSADDRRARGELDEALRQLANAVAGAAGLAVEVSVRGPLPDLSARAQHALYRIAQEALQNAVRHAAAARVRLTLRAGDGRTVLSVADDGSGDAAALRASMVDPAADTGDGQHLGLRTMRRRALDVGGRLDLRRTPGGGVTVRVAIPAQDAAA